MKNSSLIVSICSIVVALAALVFGILGFVSTPAESTTPAAENTASTEGIAFFNLDEVIAGYQMAIDLQQGFEKKATGINDEVNRRRTKLENEDKDLADKLNKGLMTRNVAEVKYNDLQKKVADFQTYGRQKEQELAEEQQVILNNIANAIKEYVEKYNKTHNYSLILSTSGALLPSPVVVGSEGINITSELISGLNSEYQNKK